MFTSLLILVDFKENDDLLLASKPLVAAPLSPCGGND
jgi:hypothetical protein